MMQLIHIIPEVLCSKEGTFRTALSREVLYDTQEFYNSLCDTVSI